MTTQADYAVTMLAVTPDAGAETLTIKSTDGSPIDLGLMKDIHFGTSATDLNLCDISSQFYKISGDPLDLATASTKATLKSQTTKDNLPDLELTLTLLETGVVNVHWTFADQTSAPFEVPVTIVQPNKNKVSTTDTLDKFVQVKGNDGSEPV